MYKYKDRVIVARSMLLLNYTLAIRLYMTRYNDCPKEHVRLFVSTGVIIRSSNITPVDDYKCFVRSSFTFEPSKPKQRWYPKA